MNPRPYWIPERLTKLASQIDEYERVAFATPFRSMVDRKKAMTLAAHGCDDDNVKHILGRSVGYITSQPEHVRRDIGLARGHVETLRSVQE